MAADTSEGARARVRENSWDDNMVYQQLQSAGSRASGGFRIKELNKQSLYESHIWITLRLTWRIEVSRRT